MRKQAKLRPFESDASTETKGESSPCDLAVLLRLNSPDPGPGCYAVFPFGLSDLGRC